MRIDTQFRSAALHQRSNGKRTPAARVVDSAFQGSAESTKHMTPVIEIQDVKKIYTMGDVSACTRQCYAQVQQGEMVAITGPSGSGKSTLMNIIGCLDTPSSGSYVLDGVDVSKLSDDEQAAIRNKKIGFVFQQFNLLPRTAALDQVELPMVYAGAPDRRACAMATLESVGLGDRVHHRPSELSGGQQQRVAIARAGEQSQHYPRR